VLGTATLVLLGATLRECGSAQAEIAAAIASIQERTAQASPAEEVALASTRRLAAPHA
jgi:hypothetical protein